MPAAPRRPGRRPARGAPASRRLNVWLTEEEAGQVRVAAAERGVSLSSFAAATLVAALKRPQ